MHGVCTGGPAVSSSVRSEIYRVFRERAAAPSVNELASRLDLPAAEVIDALHALADEHSIVLVPATDSIWMAHPFSGVATDFVVTVGERTWFANCAWDGLSILALFGDGVLETHSLVTGEPIRFTLRNRQVSGEGVVHFLVPAAEFWRDIGFT